MLVWAAAESGGSGLWRRRRAGEGTLGCGESTRSSALFHSAVRPVVDQAVLQWHRHAAGFTTDQRRRPW